MLRMTSGSKISARTEVVTLYFHHPSSETYVELDRHKAEKYNFMISVFFFDFIKHKGGIPSNLEPLGMPQSCQGIQTFLLVEHVWRILGCLRLTHRH